VKDKRPKTLAMMPFFPRDHLSATRRMTLEERGAYFDLLCHSWDSREPLPKDIKRLASLVGCTPRAFSKIWPTIRKKFTMTPDGYVNARLEIERAKSYALRTKASEKAAAAANARWSGHASSNAPSIPRQASVVLGAMLEDCPPAPAPSIKTSEDRSSRKRARPASPQGPRARPEAAVIDEKSAEVRQRRLQASQIAKGSST
jgi:uncharacterized protein YdaU (DUF1376 family)